MTYTIKLSARIYAYGEVEIEAASAEEALTAFLQTRIQDHNVDWAPDWGFSNDYVVVHEIVSEDQQEFHENLYIQGDASLDDAQKCLAKVMAQEEAGAALKNLLVITPPPSHPSFTLKFERYVQEAAWVEVKAHTLAQAMAMASELDSNELDWEEECPVDGVRLYGVFNKKREVLAKVDLSGLFGVPTWFDTDLRCQWTAQAPFIAAGEAA